jgi:uncharacterized membrane protein YraQ (UPF0718 family)
MWLLLGWQFVLGEFVGGPLMIVFLALLFRLFLKRQLVEEARTEAEKGRLGSMEGHAEMDMAVQAEGRSIWQRLRSPAGFTATANYFVMDWAAVARDIFGGLLIAGALAAWVSNSFWQRLFLEHHHTLAKFWGPLIGRRVVERRDQLRRRACLHLRRPDHPPDPRHLPQVLRLEDGRLPACDLLHDDGRCRARRRVAVSGSRPPANGA